MQQSPTVLSVSELNQFTQSILEREIGTVFVRGEISNLATPASGHIYFSLKDEKSQIRCAMFRNKPGAKGFIPKNGIEVVAQGLASIYPIRGDYQLIVDTLELSGDGVLRAKFEALKNKLEKADFFDQSRKKTLPRWPTKIGVVTSLTGAAIHDILTVIKRRCPPMAAIIYPCTVQGDNAALEIARAIFTANQRKECDVLIVARGGGSLEDLWPFNEELVAQAVFDSELPIVSGIGHEIDLTITDLVADARAPTPSAAAEIATPETKIASQQVTSFKKRLLLATKLQINAKFNQISAISAQIKHPKKDLEIRYQQTDDLIRQLHQKLELQIQISQMNIQYLLSRLKNVAPEKYLARGQSRLSDVTLKIRNIITYKYKENMTKTLHLTDSLEHLGHQRTLARGYALVSDKQGNLIKDSKELKVGQTITTVFKSGQTDSVVKFIEQS